MTVPFMKSGDKLSILANGKWYQITSAHPKYAEILEALHEIIIENQKSNK